MHGCKACGGLWLGPDATVHVLRGLDDAVDRAIDESAGKLAARAEVTATIAEGERVCPLCDQPLARVLVHHVRIDSCFTHGSWFDRAEIHEVVTVCVKLRVAQRDEALHGAFRWEVLWTTMARVWSDP